MTKTGIPTATPSDNAAAAALDTAMAMVGGAGGQGITQAGATPLNPGKSKKVEIEHLDFKYVAKCTDGKEVERILKVLRSGKEGRYFELEDVTERKLRELFPDSQLLKKMIPTVSLRAMPRSEREDLLGSLDSWSAEMEAVSSEGYARSASMAQSSRLPPVRGQASMTSAATAPAPANVEPAKATKKKKSGKAIPGGDFRAWDKYDVDGALEEIGSDGDEDDSGKTFPPVRTGADRTVVNSAGKLPKAKLSKRPGSESECQRQATKEKEKGNECFRAGDYDEAIVYYSRSLDAWPTPAVYNNRALANLKVKRYLKTIADCEKVLAREPGNFKAMVRKAHALKGASRVDEALAVISRALELKPTSKEALGIKTELLKAQTGLGKSAAPKRRMIIDEVSSEEEEEEEEQDVEEISTVDPTIFQVAKKFSGSRTGFVFQMGVHGLGYYKDPMAAAKVPVPEPEPVKQTSAPRRITIVEDDSDDSDEGGDEVEDVSTEIGSRSAPAGSQAGAGSPVRRVVVVEDDSDDDSDPSAGAEEETQATSSDPTSSEPASESTSSMGMTPQKVVEVDEPQAPPPVPKSVLAAKDEGKRLFLAGDYGEAAEHYSRALKLLVTAGQEGTPMAATLLSNRAACNLKTGQCRASVEDCNAALAISGPDAKLLLRRAAANEQRERYKDAYIDYKDVLALFRGHVVASEGFARAKKAIEYTSDFKWLREQQGKPANVKASLRNIRRPQLASGEESATKSIALQSTQKQKTGASYDELKGQGNKHVKEKRYAKAIKSYTQCIAVDPSQGAAFNNRALCHLKLKQFAKAAVDTASVLELEPKNVKAMFRRAQALAGIGSLDDARHAYEQLLKVDPKHKTGKADLVALEGVILENQLKELSTKREQIEVERKQAQVELTAVETKATKVSQAVDKKKAELQTTTAKLEKAEEQFDAGLVNMKSVLENEIEILAEGAAPRSEATPTPTPTPTPNNTPVQKRTRATPSKRSSPSKRATPLKSAPLEFMRKITALKVDSAKLAAYLETVQVDLLPRLFSNRLEADHLVTLANAAVLMPGDGGFKVMESLTNVARFDIASMLLSDDDRAVISKAFASAMESGAVEKSVVSSVASKFD